MAANNTTKNNNPVQLPNAQLLGNIVGLIKSPAPPQKKYLIWAHQVNPNNLERVVLKMFDFAAGQWVPIAAGSAVSGLIEAENVHVRVDGITETVGGRGPGNFDGTLAALLQQILVRFKAPAIVFFTFRGTASVIRPIGYQYAGGQAVFTWDTAHVENVDTDRGLTLTDLTAGSVLGTQLPTTNAADAKYPVTGFTVQERVSRTYRIAGVDTEAAAFFQDILIIGSVYRFAFVADVNLLDTTLYDDAALSAYMRAQPGGELVLDRARGGVTYSPRSQYIYFWQDLRSLDNSALGMSFKHNGQPNNGYLTRNATFTNEYGATNAGRLFRTNNVLNADFNIQTL